MGMEFCMNCMEPRFPGSVICPCCGFAAETEAAEASSVNLTPGFLLESTYLVGNTRSRIGSSFRYIALDLHTGSKVDLWEFFPDDGSRNADGSVNLKRSKESPADFTSRAKIAAGAESRPCLETAYSIIETNGSVYIAAAHHDGLTLSDLIRISTDMSPERMLQALLPIVSALADLHSQDICHGRIQADSILLAEGKFCLTGLGAPRTVSAGKAQDVFDLCLAIYQGMFRKVWNTLKRTETGKVIYPRRIDAGLARVLNKGLSLDENRRYPDIPALYQALSQIL